MRAALIALLCFAPAVIPLGAADAPTRLVVEASGAAGTWIIAQYTFPAPVDSVPHVGGFRLVVDAPPEGPPRAFFQKPAATFLFDGRSVFPEAGSAPEIVTGVAGEPLVIDLAADFGTGASGLDSIVLLAAANAPWTLRVAMSDLPGPGGDVGPTFTSRGEGAAFVEAERVPPDARDVLQQHALRAQLDRPGWSHVHVEAPWRPVAERNVTIRLPGAAPIAERGLWVSTFATDPPRGVQGGIEDYWDGYGTLAGPAGNVTAFVQDVEPATPVRVSLAHLPDAELPPSLGAKVYRAMTDRVFWRDAS